MNESFARTLRHHFFGAPDALASAEKREELLRLLEDPALRPVLAPCLVEGCARSGQLQAAIDEVRREHEKVESALEKLTAPPGVRALLVGLQPAPGEPRAVVAVGGRLLEVEVGPEVAADELAAGTTVVLAHEMNCITAVRPEAPWPGGEIAVVDQVLADGRLVLIHRDGQVVVHPSQRLEAQPVGPGDYVRFDPTVSLALEKAQGPQMQDLWVEQTPTETFDAIGGLSAQTRELLADFELQLRHPHELERFGLRPAASVLLEGPSGCGKTMMGRALANYLGALNGNGSRFINIRPGRLESKWYGESEANYRAVFRLARKAGDGGRIPVVMFFDELDSIGRTRGNPLAAAHDASLNAFLAELDGLEARGNIFVLGATNRPDLLDPALLRPGRFGDRYIRVPRPDRKAAAEIFTVYLRHRPTVGGPEALEPLIEAVVGQLYCRNDGAEVATALFRDGTRQSLFAADLMSGAIIAKVCDVAAQRACRRQIETATPSAISCEDLLEAAQREMQTLAAFLRPHNLADHVGLEPGRAGEVVAVEPTRRARRSYRYLRLQEVTS